MHVIFTCRGKVGTRFVVQVITDRVFLSCDPQLSSLVNMNIKAWSNSHSCLPDISVPKQTGLIAEIIFTVYEFQYLGLSCLSRHVEFKYTIAHLL